VIPIGHQLLTDWTQTSEIDSVVATSLLLARREQVFLKISVGAFEKRIFGYSVFQSGSARRGGRRWTLSVTLRRTGFRRRKRLPRIGIRMQIMLAMRKAVKRSVAA
jgi:hypothetical protein